MCEILGISSRNRLDISGLLRVFFSHSVEHKNGWGMVLLDKKPLEVMKEPVQALKSRRIDRMLKGGLTTSNCIAHIRQATMGEAGEANTHPFSARDLSGRLWILAHNGTIFESEILAPYQYMQEGTTDSERILLYIVDQMNMSIKEKGRSLNADERIAVIESAVRSITPGNKADLMIHDGEFLYVHKNEPGTMYVKETAGSAIFSTRPLDAGGWKETEENRVLVYRNGELIHAGKAHQNTYIEDEEKTRLLFLDYSGL